MWVGLLFVFVVISACYLVVCYVIYYIVYHYITVIYYFLFLFVQTHPKWTHTSSFWESTYALLQCVVQSKLCADLHLQISCNSSPSLPRVLSCWVQRPDLGVFQVAQVLSLGFEPCGGLEPHFPGIDLGRAWASVLEGFHSLVLIPWVRGRT